MKKFTILLVFIVTLFMSTTALAAPPPSPRDWTVKAPDGELLTNAINANYAILMDARTGEVLFEKDADVQRAPASLTKIMTCLLALENCDLTDQVTVPDLSDLASDASKAGLIVGEVLSMEDVLYGLMLRSGGDAALAIAVHISGSVDAFSELMNERAAELGMTNTNFLNPHGLTEGEHYSTARDMAILTMACMKYPKFRKIVGTYQYTCYPTNKKSESREWKNTNKLVNPSDNESFAYEYAIGVKTGYTNAAGYCLASSAAKDNMELVAVVLQGGNTQRYVDSITMYEYAFEFYDTLDLQAFLTSQPLSIPIGNAALDDPGEGSLELEMIPEGPAWITDKKETIADLRENPEQFVKSVELIPNLTAPIKKGDEVGTVTFTLNGEAVLTCSLMASRDMAARPEPTPAPGETPSATATANPISPEPTPLPDPFHNLGWIKYVLLGIVVVVGIPVAVIVIARIKRERQHKHYRYRTRR